LGAPSTTPCRASSAGPRGLRITAGPRERFHPRFILLRASVRLQSLYETVSTACRFRLGSSSHEVSCLIAPSAHRVRRRVGFHPAAAVRPQVFTTSRRFAPRLSLAGLFHPASTSRLFPSGVSPRREPSRLVAAIVPSCRYYPPGSLAGDQRAARLQGLALPESPIAFGPRLSEPCARSPRGFLPSPGPASPRPRIVSQRSSPHELPSPSYGT
jgi:hypothetical protein